MRPVPATRPRGSETAGVLGPGRLAAHVGVTVRAVRHAHSVGLLAEPARDASGDRRYGARTAAALSRIKALAGAGIPLAWIRQLLDAGPDDFAKGIAEIDEGLKDRIRELKGVRRRPAGLTAGERLVLPGEGTGLVDPMRSLGVREGTMDRERNGWPLLVPRSAEQAAKSAREESAALSDPGYQQLHPRWEQAYDWDPGDPRLADPGAKSCAWLEKQCASPPPDDLRAGIAAVSALPSAQTRAASPAWRHLDELPRQIRSPVAARRGEPTNRSGPDPAGRCAAAPPAAAEPAPRLPRMAGRRTPPGCPLPHGR